jgi:hypothetical protein
MSREEKKAQIRRVLKIHRQRKIRKKINNELAEMKDLI